MLRSSCALLAGLLAASAVHALHAAPPLLPPAPPADIETLAAATAADEATAKRQLQEAGVPAAKRTEAAAFLAKAKNAKPYAVLLDAVEECAGACGASRDLADLLVAAAPGAADDAAFLTRLAADAAAETTRPAAVRMAAYRALAALPKEKRPEAAREFAVRTVTLKAIVGAMKYDPAEFEAKPGEALEIVLENPDTMQHNFLLVAPGKLSEVGVAGEKMGATAEGKAKQFVPDLPSVLEVMGLVDPGKTGHAYFFVPQKPGTYPYVCTYPGHWRMMNGKMRVKP